MNYLDAIRKVIAHEGGAKITDNPLDPGGLTKFGISKRSYPKVDIRNLTETDAIAIYKRDFWDMVGGDLIKSYGAAFAIFDQAVNRGVSTSIKQAQKVLGITADGKMGATTIRSLNSFNDKDFVKLFANESRLAYQKIVAGNPSQQVFLKGWLNRVASLEKYVNNYTVASFGAGFIILGLVVFFLIQGSGSHNARRA